MNKAIVIVALLVLGAVLAHYHVANQSYYPVSRLSSTEGYAFTMVQDRTARRDDCGKANDRFLEPVKTYCDRCRVEYARCERELSGLELALVMGDPVPTYVVIAPGVRLAMQGPEQRIRRDCEQMATDLVRRGAKSASCVYPGTMRRP
jgi:hypothetical protein